MSLSGHRLFWLAWGGVLVLHIAIAASVMGTVDIKLYAYYGTLLAKDGFALAYAANPMFNIPPVAALFAAGLSSHFGAQPLVFAFLLRLPGILAEAALVACIWIQARRRGGLPLWAVLLLMLNPVSLGVTAFHGNLDSILAACVGGALLAAMSGRPGLCGALLGVAANLKIAPVLILPPFFFWWYARGNARPFTLVASLVILAGWSPALVACPKIFLSQVIMYPGFWGIWGMSRLLHLSNLDGFHQLGYGYHSTAAKVLGTGLKLGIVTSVTAFAWWRRNVDAKGLVATVAGAWGIFFVFAPAGAPQYLIWPVAPLMLMNPRWGAAYLASALPMMLLFYRKLAAWLLGFDPFAGAGMDFDAMAFNFGILIWAVLAGMLAWHFRTWLREGMTAGLCPPDGERMRKSF